MVSNFERKDDCAPCRKRKLAPVRKGSVGLFTGILLALLPKCPFCFMAYSSTIMLCGRTGTIMSRHSVSSSISVGTTALFCLVALVSIVLNYRDARTRYAVALAAVGSAMIIVSVAVTGGLLLYYGGVFLVFVGAWLNASLLYFVKKIQKNVSGTTSPDLDPVHS